MASHRHGRCSIGGRAGADGWHGEPGRAAKRPARGPGAGRGREAGVGGEVWPCAAALCSWLASGGARLVAGAKVLENGFRSNQERPLREPSSARAAALPTAGARGTRSEFAASRQNV